MARSPKETVEELIGAGASQEYGTLLELLSPEVFISLANGRIYIGHRGFTEWIRAFAQEYRGRDFKLDSVRELDGGYVLVSGTDHRQTARGDAEAVPGSWLFHVADGCVTACVYFRTEDEAVRKISGPGRGESPVQLVERNIVAFNRRDFAALLALADPHVRFSSGVGRREQIHEGVGALARVLVTLGDREDEPALESVELTDLGDGHVLVEGVLRTAEPAGESRRVNVAYLARVEGGQLTEFLGHADADAARAAANARNG